MTGTFGSLDARVVAGALCLPAVGAQASRGGVGDQGRPQPVNDGCRRQWQGAPADAMQTGAAAFAQSSSTRPRTRLGVTSSTRTRPAVAARAPWLGATKRASDTTLASLTL